MRNIRTTKSKIKKGLTLTAIFIGAVFMASAYSLLSRTITIAGTANLYSSDRYLWRQLKSTNPTGLNTSNYDSKKSIFTGSSPNNYISIDGIMARIVSVENDNTIKIVLLDSSLIKAFDELNNRTQLSTYCTDLTKGCNALIQKNTYTNGEIEGLVENNSSIYSYLNTIYNSLSNEAKNLIVEHTFYNGAINIESNTTLTEILTQEAADSYIGYFGLPLLSDFIYVTDSTLDQPIQSKTLDNNYLTNSTDSIKWVANPVYNSSTNVWAINYDKTIKNAEAKTVADTVNTGEDDVNYNYVTTPTAYLKSTVKLVSGTGTQADPFTIE